MAGGSTGLYDVFCTKLASSGFCAQTTTSPPRGSKSKYPICARFLASKTMYP